MVNDEIGKFSKSVSDKFCLLINLGKVITETFKLISVLQPSPARVHTYHDTTNKNTYQIITKKNALTNTDNYSKNTFKIITISLYEK